ncbi:MAG: hypothetical protein ABJB55_05000 [Actinomycetota bacterium]
MKRLTSIVAFAAIAVIVTAGAALAQTSTYPVSPDPSTSVEGTSGGTGTAFTGSSQVPVGTLLLCLLVVAGATALVVARRRAARFAG